MSEILDAIRNMPPAAADVFLLAMVGLAVGALGFAGGIWASYREDAKTNQEQPTERRSGRRRWRDG